MTLTLKQIRRLALVGQGLSKNDSFGRGINGVERAIKQLHYLQIDTISVVQRAHHHVLNTRVSNFSEPILHRLLAQRRSIFEYWSHAAAYLPMEDYRYYLPVMHGYGNKRVADKNFSDTYGSASPPRGRCNPATSPTRDLEKVVVGGTGSPPSGCLSTCFSVGN